MNIVIQKFGGTSVGSIESLENVADKIKKTIEHGENIVVVVSAMSGETNRLSKLLQEITIEQNTPEHDIVLSSGEQVSCGLLALALKKRGVNARTFLGWQLPIITDNFHTKARIKEVVPSAIIDFIHKNGVPVIAGFQGYSDDKHITTLGRGGSDTTAVALAAALDAKRCEIYTDVDGVYTCDPRLVSKARKLDQITYEEMLELSAEGAKVLQMRSVEMAMKHKVPLMVLSSFIKGSGTKIVNERKFMEEVLVTGIAYNSNQVKLTLTAVPDQTATIAKIFEALAYEKINIDIIVKNIAFDDRTNVTFTIAKEDLERARNILYNSQGIFGYSEILIDTEVAKISVVGVGMHSHYGVASLMFRTLSEKNIPVHLISTSEIKISTLIPEENLEEALTSLHTAYNLDVEL